METGLQISSRLTCFDYFHNKSSNIKDLVHNYNKLNSVLIKTSTSNLSCLHAISYNCIYLLKNTIYNFCCK